MTHMAAVRPSPVRLPRADGEVRLSAKSTPRGTAIGTLYQRGALKAVFPRSLDFTAVMVNTAGGVTGGDQFSLSAVAEAGSALTLTTQAAERAYRARPGETGRITTRLQIEAGARLSWLPQETILFDGAGFERAMRVDMAADAHLLLVEPLILGRAAMGEARVEARMSDRIEIYREGALFYRDAWHMAGDVTGHFQRAALGAGARAMATLVVVSHTAEAQLETLRAHLGPHGGASLRQPGLVLARILAEDGYQLRKRLLPALDFLTGARLPTCWRL